MRRITPNPRGMALVMAMIVVVLVTMLVAGAISFTGTELAASEVQTREDAMSSCVQAARNLFLSKYRKQMASVPDPLNPTSPNAQFLPIQFNEDLHQDGTLVNLRTGHLGKVASLSAEKVDAMTDQRRQTINIIARNRDSSAPEFYTVTAVCRETADLASPEREIEFIVRVGL